MEIIKVSRIQTKEMFAIEAEENGYRVDGCHNHTLGFELTYEDGYKSWCPCSIIAHNAIPSSDKYFIPAIESNMPEYIYRMYDEFEELKNKFIKLQDFIKTDKFKQFDICRQNYMKLQYTFMEGYLSVLSHRIYDEMKLNGFEVNMR